MGEPFATVLALYQQGRYLAAWEAGQAVGPLEAWEGTAPRVLAGRLATRLGAPRLGSLLHLRAFRADPTQPDAQYYYVWRVFERRGPLAAWRERCRLGLPDTGDPEHLADYYGQCSQLLGCLREFAGARSCMERAEAAKPGRLHTSVEWSDLFLAEDRYEEALAAAQRGLAANGRYPSSILATAQALLLLNRGDAALELLSAKTAESENSEVVGVLLRLLLKRRLLPEAAEAVARLERLTPLKEKEMQGRIAWTRAQLAILKGDYRGAVAYLDQADHPYYDAIGEHLRAFLSRQRETPGRRVEHPVAFVRQHYRTCAPATLSAISAFWNRPAEHLAVAEEICYDGTPAHSERRWAEENGWRAREFRVDWASATALLDRGVPFTLATNDTTAGHLQAVIGYDEPTGVLLSRDPTVPDTVEINAGALLEQQRSMGPRGMAMVPAERADLLDGLDLPEAELYDRYHALHIALDGHDRAEAVRCYQALVAADPAHRLTLSARAVLAQYDTNVHESLAATDAQLSAFPDDPRLQLARLHGLQQLARREERLSWLRQVCARPGADPMLHIEVAAELSADDRELPEAAWHLRRAVRRRPVEPYALFRLAQLEWRTGRRQDAIELYRFAANLDETNESYAREYFNACRWEKQADTALAYLTSRVERLGGKSGYPAMTLCGALETLGRSEEAFVALSRAVERHPEDGALRLFAAAQCARYGRLDEARAHRDAAVGRVKHTVWLAEMASEARLRGEREQALAHWREIVRWQPLDLQAHNTIALLLSETSTRFEAVEHLQSVCERFPHHAGLHRLLYDWTAGDPAVDRERVLRRMAAIDPADTWVKRELALNLHQQARAEEALAVAQEAVALDAGDSWSHSVAGNALDSLGRSVEAAASFREAIRLSADNASAIRGLLDLAEDSPANRQEVLEFVEARLLEQTVLGDGLLAFREAARGVLTPDELLDALRRAHRQRPDLWHAWSALASHLSDMGRADEALDVLGRATERFPGIPRLWFDLSRVYQARLEGEREIEALERCRELNPDWTEATLALCDAWVRDRRQDESVRLLEGAIKRTPLVPDLRGRLASLLYERGDVDRALDTVREILRLNPDLPWAWEALNRWSASSSRATAAVDLARAFAQSRPGESRPWVQVAELNLEANAPADALDAAERALAVNPRLGEAYDAKARALVMLRRFADAEAACRPEVFRERPPVPLQGRAAWVDAKRGDITAAVKRMQAVLKDHPDYRWGWERLVEWCAEQQRTEEAMKAAERLAWLDPGSVFPLGWAGELKKRTGDRAGAKAVFERAMRLDPSYLFAGFAYFAIQREEGDLQGAKRTLEILRLHAPKDRVMLAQLEIAADESDRDRCLALVREMCRDKTSDGESLSTAIALVTQKQWGRKLERVLRDLLATPQWHERTPALWAKVRVYRGRLGGIRSYRWLAGLGRPGRDAILEFLDEIGSRAQTTDGSSPAFRSRPDWHLFWIRRACREWRAADDTYWGQVGYALLSAGRQRAAIRWMRDWQTRKEPAPWALLNLVSALLYRRRDREARTVLRYVGSELAPKQALDPLLALWSILAACLDGDLVLARRLLHETPRDVLGEQDQALRAFAETMVAILEEPPGRASLTRDRRNAIEEARVKERHRSRARLVRLATYHIARRAKDPWMTMQTWLDLRPGLLIAAAVAALFGTIVLLG